MIVDLACGLINYHIIEISSSYNIIVKIEKISRHIVSLQADIYMYFLSAWEKDEMSARRLSGQ